MTMSRKVSIYQELFTARFPNARHTVESSAYRNKWTVYAGDYLCAEAYSRAEAYRLALDWANKGLITPDPNEQAAA